MQEIINLVFVAADIAHHLKQVLLVFHLVHPEHLLAYFSKHELIVLLLALHLLFLLLLLLELLSHVLALVFFALLHEVPQHTNFLAAVFLEIETEVKTISQQ